jgi:hypothetical protein
MLTRRTSAFRFAAAAASACSLALAPVARAGLVPSAGSWPAPVTGAANPLVGTAYVLNGAHATANARLRVWLPAPGRECVALTRAVGDRTVVRGELRNLDTRRGIGGATLTLVAEDASIGQWAAIANVRTSRHGRFRGVLPVTARHLRVAVVYFPAVTSVVPVFSRRVLVRSGARVWLGAFRRARRTVRFHGRVGGAPVPPAGLVVALQVRNNFGRWVTARLTRTQPDGRYRVAYRFPRAARLLVRVRVPGGQPGWALFGGASAPVRVRVR